MKVTCRFSLVIGFILIFDNDISGQQATEK